MEHQIVETPEPDTVSELFDACKRQRACCLLHTRCEVEYDGRATSSLDVGDRLVLYKPDGTLLVHTDDGREPQNWQPPGATVQITDRDPLTLVAIRSSPKEVIEIVCREVGVAMLLRMDDDATIDLQGSEEDLRQRIFDNPAVIEAGFRPQQREYDTPAGPVDVWGADRDGRPVILELKRRRVGPDAVSQLRRYVESLESDVRGILVAPSVTDRAAELLDEFGLEYREVDPPTQGTPTDQSLVEFVDDADG